LPLGSTVVPANEKEYEPLADLLTGTPAEFVVADKGLRGDYKRRLAAPTAPRFSPRTKAAPPPTSPSSARSLPAGS